MSAPSLPSLLVSHWTVSAPVKKDAWFEDGRASESMREAGDADASVLRMAAVKGPSPRCAH